MFFLKIIIIIIGFLAVHGPVFISSETQLEERIVGGKIISIEDAPFQVSLQDKNGNHICSGSLFKENRVVTTAICIDGNERRLVEVRANSADKSQGGEILKVLELHVHKSYWSIGTNYDYAVLEIEPTKTVKKFATLIGKAEDKLIEDGQSFFVSGWGHTLTNNSEPNLLRGVTVEIINFDNCTMMYYGWVTENMICAGSEDGSRDACYGDRGGPLFDQATNTLVGMVSWGGCADPEAPRVYSRIGRHSEWMLSI